MDRHLACRQPLLAALLPLGDDLAKFATPVLDFEPLTDAPFRASFEPILDGTRFVRAEFSAGLTIRSKELVKDGDDAFALTISRSRNLEATQRGRELRLGRGEATLLRVSEPGIVGSGGNFKFEVVMIPFAEIEMPASRLDSIVARQVPRRSEALRLLYCYLRSLEKCRRCDWAEGHDIVRRHIIDLATLALKPRGSIGESNLSAVVIARRSAALDYIAACFQDPELSVTKVANSQGLSTRYLQHLIETTGQSFTAHVNELRLQGAFALLNKAHDSGRRISDIALEAGFSDISYFSRLFRSRFGDTPSAIRGQVRRPR
jgi:AraC-like DNA-binding protein